MKLLYITNGISAPGGLERVLSIKASYLADKLGYEVHIITLNDAHNSSFYMFSTKIQFHDISYSGNTFQCFLRYVHGVRRIVKSINPDIISVCDDGLKGFFVPFLFGRKPCPMIYERHVSRLIALDGRKSSWIDFFRFKFMNIGASFYDRMIVLTHDNLTEWSRLDNLQVISNPLSFYPEKVSSLKSKRIIAVGKISYQKGYERLVEAWKLIHKDVPNWSIHIYGSETDGGKIRRLIKEYNLQDQIYLHAPTQNIEREYLGASIYAFPSRYEGFGMVLTEAMACGVPCVSFDCPCGPRDIIYHDIDGILVENDNIPKFANSLLKLIEDEVYRYKLAQNARQNVTRYCVENIIREWHTLFQELKSNEKHIV